MDEKELAEIEGLLAEERLRQRQFVIFVPRCECGMDVRPGDPDVELEGDLEKVPPRLVLTCPRCGRKIEAEFINAGARA